MNRFDLLANPAREGSSDLRLSLALNRWPKQRLLRSIFLTTSRLGDGILWYLLIGVTALMNAADGLMAVHLAVLGIANTVIYSIIKRSLKRPRPFASHTGITAFASPLDEFSFPSGHTMHAVAFTVVACSYLPAFAWALIPFTALTAVSRVALGLHYSSDVGLGAILGFVVANVSLWAFV